MPNRKPRTHIVRRVATAAIDYRGKRRAIVAQLDPKRATISVRLKGCRKLRTYQLEDLFIWGPQLSLI